MTLSRRTLVIASLGTVVTLVAFTAPLATVIQTSSALGAGASGRTWILSSMSIGLGAFLLTAGRVADDFGRRRAFVVGSVLLLVGAVLAAIAPGTVSFVLARVVQGVGGAAVIAAGLGMIAHTFPAGPERARATGIWGASVGAGIAVGPLLSSGLARAHSWRDVYVVLAAAAVGLALAALGLEESRAEHVARLDVPGVVLLGLGMASLLAGLTEGRLGWTRPLVVVLLAAGVTLLAAFVVAERRSSAPMIDLGLLRRPAFAAVTMAALATGGGIISLLSYLPGFAGAALGMSSWSASFLMLAWSATSIVTALAARRLPESWSGRSRLAGSLLVIGIGQLLLLGVSASAGATRFLPGLLVAGVGSGVLNAALGRESVASVPAGQGGLGSGANNTARYLGSALGVTVVSVVAAPSGVPTASGLVDGWERAVLVTAVISLLGAGLVRVVGGRRTPEAGASAEPHAAGEPLRRAA